jgi:hypothetical protein
LFSFIILNSTRYHGNIGDRIIVTAGDDFRVDSVTVRITGPDGRTIEEGVCEYNARTGNYSYCSTVRISALEGVVIHVRVKDTPGNVKEHSLIPQ